MFLVRWYPLEVIDEAQEMYQAPEGCDWVSNIDFMLPKKPNWDLTKADMDWVAEMVSGENWLAIFKRHNEESWSNERYCCDSQKKKVLENVEFWKSEKRRLAEDKREIG
jgi:hypothetical protein